MRRLWALVLAVLLLSACAAPEEEPEVDWGAYQQELPAESGAPEEPEEPELPAAFALPYHRDHSLDPVTCGEGIQQDLASLIYEPLFRLDGNFEPVPVLCESCEWDDAGLVCTLRLREDACFQDGSRVTAKDAAAALNRAAASERYGYRLRGMASAAANRRGELVVTLSAPDRGLPALLDIPVVKNGTQERTIPMGSGPYRFVSDGDGARLEADPDWWQQKPLPVQTIPLVNAKDRDTAMYLFSTRQVELVTVDPTDDRSAVTGQSENTDRPTTLMQFVGFNTVSGVFADPAARAAFSNGIPREKLVSAQLAGLALPAQFPVSPLSRLYPRDLERPYVPEDTLAALRAAGQDTGEIRELRFLVSAEDSFHLTSARFIAESLTKLDWRVTVTALPWEEYLAALAAGDFDLYFGEVRLTANWDLTDLLGTAGALNYGGFTAPAMDALLLTFAAAGDQTAAFRVLASQLLSSAPIAPVCFKSYTVLTHPGVVEGMGPSVSSTFFGVENWAVHLAAGE